MLVYSGRKYRVFPTIFNMPTQPNQKQVLTEYKVLLKRYWGQHLWARGYWVASSGNVTDEVWKEYIKNQKPPKPDDDSTVV